MLVCRGLIGHVLCYALLVSCALVLQELAVLDLVATTVTHKGEGHCRALLQALEGWLGPDVGVAKLVAVCPNDVSLVLSSTFVSALATAAGPPYTRLVAAHHAFVKASMQGTEHMHSPRCFDQSRLFVHMLTLAVCAPVVLTATPHPVVVALAGCSEPPGVAAEVWFQGAGWPGTKVPAECSTSTKLLRGVYLPQQAPEAQTQQQQQQQPEAGESSQG